MPPRRLRPGQDIYRIEKRKNVWMDNWVVLRYAYGVPRGFPVSEHDSRDQARAAKRDHEQRYDQARREPSEPEYEYEVDHFDRSYEKGTDE